MSDRLFDRPNGYQETIGIGIEIARSFSGNVSRGAGSREENTERLKKALDEAEAVVIGAGAGLSTSAGFTYTGERFRKYFGDFAEKYHYSDMYSGGFHHYSTPEENWAYWSRYIYINRFMPAPKPVYEELFELVKNKDYFVITTNVDHQFQKAGFDKERLFYTQGDYGLWQCSKPCHKRTYDNKSKIVKMLIAQGFGIGEKGELLVPEKENGETDFSQLSMTIPSGLVPYCPVCGELMTMNLRGDDTFVEDEGWNEASERYSRFLSSHRSAKTLFLEMAVGHNTPVIIKYPFWSMTYAWDDAVYACVNYGEAYAPEEILEKAICINDDAGKIIKVCLD